MCLAEAQQKAYQGFAVLPLEEAQREVEASRASVPHIYWKKQNPTENHCSLHAINNAFGLATRLVEDSGLGPMGAAIAARQAVAARQEAVAARRAVTPVTPITAFPDGSRTKRKRPEDGEDHC